MKIIDLRRKHKIVCGNNSCCYNGFRVRLRKHEDIKKAINTPTEGHGGDRYKNHNSEYKRLYREHKKACGNKSITYGAIYQRVYNGWSEYEIINKPRFYKRNIYINK